jgi:integrase
MEQDILRRDLKDALIKIGLKKEDIKNYTFHGWRHYFTAYMRTRIDDKLLQFQTGHRDISMLRHYSDHRIIGDKERIQKAQIETFECLLPDYSGIINSEEK